MPLESGRKPENLEGIHTDTEKTCKLHTESAYLSRVWNPGTACCEATVLTTTPRTKCVKSKTPAIWAGHRAGQYIKTVLYRDMRQDTITEYCYIVIWSKCCLSWLKRLRYRTVMWFSELNRLFLRFFYLLLPTYPYYWWLLFIKKILLG